MLIAFSIFAFIITFITLAVHGVACFDDALCVVGRGVALFRGRAGDGLEVGRDAVLLAGTATMATEGGLRRVVDSLPTKGRRTENRHDLMVTRRGLQ